VIKTIHYIDYCTMAMLKKLAPEAYSSVMANHYDYSTQEYILTDTDIVVFEGFRTIEEDGTFGPHNLVKVCSVCFYGPNCAFSDVMLGVFQAVLANAHTYGAKHFITRNMFRKFNITVPTYLTLEV
jgi:hypothetical protein